MRAINVALFACLAAPTHALIFYGTADPEHNTTAPTADLAANGWNLQGNWGDFQATPIGPHHFITAMHIGGVIGQIFTFRGVEYPTVAVHPDASSDFQIWEVAGTFPEWAQLYDGTTETGLDLVVFGRGSIRGPEVTVNGLLKGWQWAASDMRLRWGRNKVSSIVADPNHSGSELLMAQFNSNATADEAHLGSGDSGGGVFILQNNVWRLAGINYSVDGFYNNSNSGPGFGAAIFDQGGLYVGVAGDWTFVPDRQTAQPSSFYATRIKTRLAWIQSVLAAPSTPVLVESANVAGPYSPASGATIDTNAKTITFTPSPGTHFYQIENLAATISISMLSGTSLTLHYQ